MVNSPKVVVVVLNYRRPQDTIECIASLIKSNYLNIEIVIVDNASGDDSVQQIQLAYKNIHILVSEANLGYAGGMNIGIKYAMQKSPVYILVMNSDTIVDKSYLGILVNALELDTQAAAASGTIYYHSKQDKVWYAGGNINYLRASVFQKNGYIPDKVLFKLEGDVTFLSGCAFLVKTSALKKVGLFDERFFMYIEDTELSERIIQNKYKLLFIPHARIFHKVNIGYLMPYAVYFNVRNRLLFVSTLPSITKRMLGFTYLYFICISKIVFWKITKPRLADAVLYGVQDFFLKPFYAGRAFQLEDNHQ